MKLSEKAQAALDAVVARFQQGDLSPIVQVAWISRDILDQMPSRRWSFNNQIMAVFQTGTLDCRGYRQWQEAGRQVKRGASAAYILGPCTYTFEDDEGTRHTALRGFKSIPVFPVYDTDGEEVPEFDYSPDPDALPPLMAVAEALGVAVSWAPTAEETAALGWYSPSREAITLGSHDVSVFFHELGHALHKHTTGLQGGQAYKETVAEFTACVLMWLYGAEDRSGNAWHYIKHYNPDPLQAIYDALQDVSLIISTLEEIAGRTGRD